MRFLCALVVTIFAACSRGEKKTGSISKPVARTYDSLQLPDQYFSIQNGVAFYKGKPFNGTAIESYPSGKTKSSVEYLNGREDGFSNAYYSNGKLEYNRFYRKGEKDSVHTGWWSNGNKRFEYHFAKGIYDGTFKEWYENGNPAKNILYKDGKEIEGKGWRDSGKVYMSFVVKDGRRYGLVNAQLCYSVKK